MTTETDTTKAPRAKKKDPLAELGPNQIRHYRGVLQSHEPCSWTALGNPQWRRNLRASSGCGVAELAALCGITPEQWLAAEEDESHDISQVPERYRRFIASISAGNWYQPERSWLA